MDLSPLDYMMKKFPEIKERDEMRKIIGRYGITGKQQVKKITWNHSVKIVQGDPNQKLPFQMAVAP